jgi:hypothetical protein
LTWDSEFALLVSNSLLIIVLPLKKIVVALCKSLIDRRLRKAGALGNPCVFGMNLVYS